MTADRGSRPPAAAAPDSVADAGDRLEVAIGRILTVGTYAAVAFLAAGVLLLLAAGRSPLEGGPRLDPSRLVADLLALRPEGYLWLGLVAVIATPSARVTAALIGYAGRGDRTMAFICLAILAVIALGVALGMSEG